MVKRKDSGDGPQISEIWPRAAIAGGEFHIRGRGLAGEDRPHVTIGNVAAPVVIGSDSHVVVRVPEGAQPGDLIVGNGKRRSAQSSCQVGVQVADSLHPVANPAIDSEGNIYSTLSGSRGQKTPVSVYKIDGNYELRPFLTDLMNATGMAFDHEGYLYISSRHDGIVYRATPSGHVSIHVEGMGIATGLAFDPDNNLYVGDRSGTIFKISPDRQIYVFATIEASISAYHLAFGPDDYLYVTGPTTSSFDCIHRISPAGDVETFYRGLGRPQGMAFDAGGNLHLAASLGGRRGVVRITPEGEAELFVSGPNIVGLAFTTTLAMILATNTALYRVDVGVRGRPLP